MSSSSALPHQEDALTHNKELSKQLHTSPPAEGATGGKPHEAQSDISKMRTESDGSFKRKAASFRNFIEPNGEFAPEKGAQLSSWEWSMS